MRLHLSRNYTNSYCILGRMTELQSGRGWETMEPLDCLPCGEYRVERYSTEAYANMYAVSAPTLGVYVRESDAPVSVHATARLRQVIQPASFPSEIRGGIAVGKDRQRQGGYWTLYRSRDAMNEVRNALGLAMDVTLSITSGSVESRG